jgi:phospholipase/carboxylesterase
MTGDRRSVPVSTNLGGAGVLAEARFIPQRYEPNYAYPLLVLFHGRGSDEHQLLTAMPAMSWRNYIGLGLRGPEAIVRKGREAGYGWGSRFARFDSCVRPVASRETPAQSVRRALTSSTPDPLDRLETSVFESIRGVRRSLHVHSERIFLAGLGEGAAVAYWLALRHPELFAGLISINGWLPSGAPLLRVRSCRELRLLSVHGEWNSRVPVDRARRDVATLRAGGLRVSFQSYPCGHRMTAPMLRDVDSWLMQQCTNDRM